MTVKIYAQEFFEKNHLNQVFTHPYTPQENGHIESFHSILSNALGNQVFWSLDQLIQRLTIFYEKYNNVRLHGSIANLTPRLFWELWNKGLIIRTVNEKTKQVKFKLMIPYQQLSGNGSLREVPCLNLSAQPRLNKVRCLLLPFCYIFSKIQLRIQCLQGFQKAKLAEGVKVKIIAHHLNA